MSCLIIFGQVDSKHIIHNAIFNVSKRIMPGILELCKDTESVRFYVVVTMNTASADLLR